jgi:hypothetical protein
MFLPLGALLLLYTLSTWSWEWLVVQCVSGGYVVCVVFAGEWRGLEGMFLRLFGKWHYSY